MPYKTSLAEALRDWGLPVVEVNGWRTRGSSSFNPKGSVNHHTAGSRRNSLPSYNILVNGRAGLPGPLCNVAQTRSTEFNSKARYDDVYVIAAGRANHAGTGGWRGITGNSSVFGLEIEHTGNLSTEPWPERRAETAYRIHCAFAQVGGFSSDMVCQHKEWAPSRKIDFIGSNGAAFRDNVKRTQRVITPIQEMDDMTVKLAWLQETAGSNKSMHCYGIMGNVASWYPTHDSINLARFLGTPWVSGSEAASYLDPVWWKPLAIQNGPLKNI